MIGEERWERVAFSCDILVDSPWEFCTRKKDGRWLADWSPEFLMMGGKAAVI